MKNPVFQTLATFILSAILLAMFNSGSLQMWSYDLEPGPVADEISLAADAWNGWMIDLGSAGMTESVRNWFAEIAGI